HRPAAVLLPRITKPIVQTIGPALPEFHRFRDDAISAPVRRELDTLLSSEALSHLSETSVENSPRVDHFTLARNPCAQLAAAGPGMKVFFRFRARSLFDGAGDPDLPFQGHPVNAEGGMWIHLQVAALVAVIIGKENKAAFIESLEEHYTD